jgi:hypothetical protein
MKSKVTFLIASALLLGSCNGWGEPSPDEFVSYLQSKGAFSDPTGNGNQVLGIFKDSVGGKAWLMTVHGYVDNRDTCEQIIKPYNDGTLPSDMPGRYTCEVISGNRP